MSLSVTACNGRPGRAGNEQMLKDISAHYRANPTATGRVELDARVESAMRRVPRHEFVPDGQKPVASDDRALAIGHGQTISQPYIVALMTDLAGVDADDVVLEIGTGSGYQAAVLAELAKQVYSIEIIEELAADARRRLARLGYTNIETRAGDGYKGWPEHGPFDAILVTAAPDHIPPPLIEQLKPGGRLVIPVGPRSSVQQLIVLEKGADGQTTERRALSVAFVPFTGAR